MRYVFSKSNLGGYSQLSVMKLSDVDGSVSICPQGIMHIPCLLDLG